MNSLATAVIEYVRAITDAGPESVGFDGLRTFQHRTRIRQHLTGHAVDVVPVTIDLWPTVACDSGCPLCQYRRSGARQASRSGDRAGYLTRERAAAILESAARCGVRSIIFTGGGEPLLNTEIADFAKLCCQNGLRWGLITNGHMLSEPIASTLFAYAPAFLRVSLNAGSPESYKNAYGLDERFFDKTVRNTVAAGKLAAVRGQPVGVSFALPSTTDDAELSAIRKLIHRMVAESGRGVRFVVFRPMLEHYEGLQPICPQRQRQRFRDLPGAIKDLVVRPLIRDYPVDVRLDIKEGLFLTAGMEQLPLTCVSAGWMTTITDSGEGYMTGELAGQESSGLAWGSVTSCQPFEVGWCGQLRRELHELLVQGRIVMPLVHRTTPLDTFLQGLDKVTGGAIEEQLADEVIGAVTSCRFYRSAAYDFV